MQIDNGLPESARIGLLHLVYQLVEKDYVGDWKDIRKELQRIGRILPSDQCNEDQLLLDLPWDRVLDFCERLYANLAQDVYSRNRPDDEVLVPRSEVQEYIAKELQQLFLEENLAFEFSGGIVRRRGRRHTTDQISRTELVLGDPRFSKGREHYNKAVRYFRNVAKPDYENVFKEAVCAVEAVIRALFPDGGSKLSDVVKSITGSEAGQIPAPIAKTFHGLYGFRNSGEGVGHGGADGGPATKELAEYALAVAASQIILLVDLAAAAEPDVPF